MPTDDSPSTPDGITRGKLITSLSVGEMNTLKGTGKVLVVQLDSSDGDEHVLLLHSSEDPTGHKGLARLIFGLMLSAAKLPTAQAELDRLITSDPSHRQ